MYLKLYALSFLAATAITALSSLQAAEKIPEATESPECIPTTPETAKMTEKIENSTEKSIAKEKEAGPPKIGNFSLPTSQQPAALFGFGGNIIDADEIQFYFFADTLLGKRRIISDAIPGILFGINDDSSIFFNVPIAPEFRDGRAKSNGFEDCFIQYEYAFYQRKKPLYIDQATLVTNITIPTGSTKKDPPTGFGAPSFFVGGTFYRTYVDWILFTAQGAILTTSDHGTKIGDQFLYQFGIGKNICTPHGLIYAWMIEIDGQYNKKNRIKGKIDSNSGGNIVFVTPSIWGMVQFWVTA